MAGLAELLPLILLMLAAGLFGGILAGLLGVGGGIVIVPVLELALGIIGVDPSIRMHIAVATSLSTIIPTAVSSTRAHHEKGSVDFNLVKRWAPMVFLGAILGTIIAAQVTSATLSAIFAVIATLVAIKMLLPGEGIVLGRPIPLKGPGLGIPLTIGGVSAMMGIGGGTLSVPSMTLFGYPIHRAVGTSALFGLVISIPSTVSYMVVGHGHPGLPAGSIGFVNVIGFLLISPTTWLAAPWGAKLAHVLSKRHLTMVFACFLLVVAARMFYRAFLAG